MPIDYCHLASTPGDLNQITHKLVLIVFIIHTQNTTLKSLHATAYWWWSSIQIKLGFSRKNKTENTEERSWRESEVTKNNNRMNITLGAQSMGQPRSRQ